TVHAARFLAFRPHLVRVLPSDVRFRLAPETLRAAITVDLARGLTPFGVAATGGATYTGSVDPLEALARGCHEHGAWLHVDASYGGFTLLADPGLLPGLTHADSVTLDLHKGLYQPFEWGRVLARNGHDLGPRGSAHALKLWVSLRSFGLEAFREAIRRSLEVAAAA